ncbi:MAG TPA: adenylate/guanylate cyclase domain-containing protein [Acidimicrobiales bacterium]|nr:adenylate/guanylate cyclase domain-containing protein [Acidimicrobiales bacterium]
MVERDGSETIDDFLRSMGATDEQVDKARRECRFAGLAADLVLARGATLSADDLAARVGLPVDQVLSLWHTLGVVVPDAVTPMFSERDAELTLSIIRVNPIGQHGDELLRVLGSSLARVAEAAVSLYVQTVEPSMDVPEVDIVVWAKDLANVTAAALDLGDAMGVIFGHHLRDAIDRQRVAQVGIAERSLFRLAVGFIDLVGFTPLSLHTSPSELLELIGAFEVKSFEVAASHGGRIVKHIGDEVMFVALDAASGCSIALDLMAAGIEGVEPRGGVAFGDVITRHGDYYGTVVNLASRLADLAIPKEVLVDAATARSPVTPFSFRPAGHRLLKGFDDPFEVYSLELAPEG